MGVWRMQPERRDESKHTGQDSEPQATVDDSQVRRVLSWEPREWAVE